MQDLVGSDTLIQDHYGQQRYRYHEDVYQPHENYAPQSQNIAMAFQERVDAGQYPASPKFYRQNIRYRQEQHPQQLSPRYSNNKLMNQIKPYMEHILSDQNVNSKEVQKGLQHLRDIHEKMVEDVSAEGLHGDQIRLIRNIVQDKHISSQEQREGDTNYLLEIQRTVDELIANAQQESTSFKASLHHLKNVNTNVFNDEEGNEHQSHGKEIWQEEQRQRDRGRERQVKRVSSGSLNSFLQGISNLQERLFNEIMVLREEKQEVINQLNIERQSYSQLEKKYRILQKQYNKLLHQQDGKSANAYEDFSDILHKSVQPSASHFKMFEPVRERHSQNTVRHHNSNIRQQIRELENRLRAAERQKSNLKQQIQHVRSRTGRNHQLQQQIRQLDSDLAISERKAAALFPYKMENDSLVDQIQELRQTNQTIDRDRSYRVHSPPQDQRYTKQNGSYADQIKRYENDQMDRGRHKSRFAGQTDKLSKYRQVLSSMRSVNR